MAITVPAAMVGFGVSYLEGRSHAVEGTASALFEAIALAPKAIGTGRNVPTGVTRMIPPRITCAMGAWAGTSSMSSAPRTASTSGNAVRYTQQKRFA